MRPNPLKPRLAAGGHAFGTMVFEFFTPGIAQICKAAGADFVLYDLEHSGADLGELKAQFAACRGLGIVPMVRVPQTQYHFIARMLDSGAMGIMVPMVDSVEQAREIVAATRYPPLGKRGAGFAMAHDDYEPGDVKAKMQGAHDRTFTICQIESPAGVAAADAIAALDGVDCLWLGHFDLTNFMGIPGAFDDPRYRANVETIVAACKRHGKTPGFMAGDDAWAKDYLARGFRIIAYGVDSAIFRVGLQAGIAGMRKQVETA